jgi:hypothetical protein
MLRGLAPPEPPRPQYYDVTCILGHHLQGQRTEGYQALRCPTCGEGMFVLPQSPLPDPPAPREKAKRADVSDSDHDDGPIALSDPPLPSEAVDEDAEVEWVDEESPSSPTTSSPADDAFEAIIPKREEPADPAPRPVSRPKPAAAVAASGDAPAVATKPARSAANDARRPKPASRPSVSPTIVVVARPSFKERLIRRRVLLLGIFVAMTVVGTVVFKVWRDRLANLPQMAEANLAEGTEAMERGDFISAKLKLNAAASALEKLGDDKAADVRQKADEAAILADRVDPRIEEVLLKATRFKTADEWNADFARNYRGSVLLVDAVIVRKDPAAPIRLNYRPVAGPPSKPIEGWVDLSGFKLMEAKSYKHGDPITFGARLDAIVLEPDGRWRIVLDPDSGVFMNDRKALSLINGWPAPEAVTTEEEAR